MSSVDEAKSYPPSFVLSGHACAVSAVSFAKPLIVQPSKGTGANDASQRCILSISRNVLVTGDQSGEVRVWDLRTRRPMCSFNATAKPGSDDATLKIRQQCQGILGVEIWICQAVDPFDISAVILTHSRSRNANIWTLRCVQNEKPATLAHLLELPVEQFGFCNCATYHPASSQCLLLAFPGDSDGSVVLHEIAVSLNADENSLHVERQSLKYLSCATGFKCGQAMYHEFWTAAAILFLIVAFESGHIVVCDVEMNASVAIVRAFPEPALCVAHFYDRTASELLLFAASAEGTLQCYTVHIPEENLRLGERPSTSAMYAAHLLWEYKLPLGVCRLALRPSDRCRMLAVAGWDHCIRLFDARVARVVSVLQHHRGQVFGIDFASPQIGYDIAGSRQAGDVMASCSGDRSIAVWKL